MSLNRDALQKLLLEMDNQLNKSRAELSLCNLQLDRVNTNIELINSSTSSLKKHCDIESNENIWQGVGKSFIRKDVNNYLNDISEDKKQFEETKDGLIKKQRYLETTLEKTIDNMTKIVEGKAK